MLDALIRFATGLNFAYAIFLVLEQIVKPMEGSQTLHTWSQLATPSLSGLLDERPGIKTRGGAELEDLGLHIYSLTDVEEDEEVIHPGKSFQQSGHIYTYTNSTVMHPDDGTSVTSRYVDALSSQCRLHVDIMDRFRLQ